MSPFNNQYTPEENMEVVDREDNNDKNIPRPSPSPEAVKPDEDQRPIHRLRKGRSRKVRQGFVQRPLVSSRKDADKAEFRDGFLTCAALLQSYVRSHPRMSNRLKDELLISIHHYNQLLLTGLQGAGGNRERSAQPTPQGQCSPQSTLQEHCSAQPTLQEHCSAQTTPQGHCSAQPTPQEHCSAQPTLQEHCSAVQEIKQEPLSPRGGDFTEGSYRESASPDRMSELSSGSVTSHMTSSETLGEESMHVESPLYMRRPEVFTAEVQVERSITCRHCNEDMRRVTCRYPCGQEGCLSDGEGSVYDVPQSEPEDLSTTRGDGATTDSGDMWRPW